MRLEENIDGREGFEVLIEKKRGEVL